MAEDEVTNNQSDEEIITDESENEKLEESKEEKEEKEEKDESSDESVENEEEKTEKLEKEEEEEKEEKEETEESSLRPTYKQITEKYPKFFKEFPDLRHSFFAEKKYRQIFSTVEEAEEVRDQYDGIKELSDKFLNGTVENLVDVFNDVKSTNKDSTSKIASNFLPALYKFSREDYEIATTPILESLVRTLFNESRSSKNENLENAAKLVSTFLFGDEDVATGKKTFVKQKQDIESSEEKKQFDKEKREFHEQQWNLLSRNVSTSIKSILSKDVSKSLNIPDKGLNEILTEKVLSEIDRLLMNDKSHLDVIDRMWKKASIDGFSDTWKDKIVSAYLARARTVMPSIKNKVTSKISRSQNSNDQKDKFNKEISGVGTGKGSKGSNSIPSSKIDYRKTSDADIIDEKITTKK